MVATFLRGRPTVLDGCARRAARGEPVSSAARGRRAGARGRPHASTASALGADRARRSGRWCSTPADRLPGDVTDPRYPGQVIVHDLPAHRQLRRERRGRGVPAGLGRRLRRARPGPPVTSSWRAQRSLDDELVAHGVAGISEVDTRALTRHLRERGAMRAGLFSGQPRGSRRTSCCNGCRPSPSMAGRTCRTRHDRGAVRRAGARRRSATGWRPSTSASSGDPAQLAQRGIEVTVLPATATAAELLAAGPDGVFLSNGPGRPGAATTRSTLTRAGAARAACPFSASASATRSSASRSGAARSSCGSATTAATTRCGPGDRPGRDHRQNHNFAVDAPLDERRVATGARTRSRSPT